MAGHVGDVVKLQRKQNKKITKIKEQLARKDNVIACEYPTAILCVQNAGLDNGVCQEDLHSLFSRHGQVQDIIMVPRKPFCFVCYDTGQSAAAAREKLTGHLMREGKDPSQNITLYPFFVASAPSNVCPSNELPPGLLLLEDFITVETEQLLLESVSFEEQGSCSSGGSLKHREVKHYGYEFKYGINNVDPSEPLPEGIPEQCREFLQRAVDTNIVSHFPDQLTVNRYLPGQGIPSHVDTPSAFEDGIMALSCGSQVIMDFRHPDGRPLSVLLPPRSLLVMTGESRYVWSHGITPRKSDIVPLPTGGITLAARGVRVSFTFRKLSSTAGLLSPDQTERANCLPQTEGEAVALEKQHVHQVYEEIADHFSDTRHKPWPQIAQFLMDQEPASILVDIGCGNGKYFGVNPQLCQIGSDRSQNLAGIVQSRGFQVFVGDVLAIPLRSACVDVAMCIAVIHHLSTKARREHAVEELVRILRPGGCVLIYVWAQEQQKDNQKSTYLKPLRQHRQEARTQGMETACQTGEETSSQTGEKSSCQTDEKASCQTGEKASCQTDEETSSQTGEKASCQTDEETSSQTGEKSSCQTGEKVSRQTGQKTSCKELLSDQTEASCPGERDRVHNANPDTFSDGSTSEQDERGRPLLKDQERKDQRSSDAPTTFTAEKTGAETKETPGKTDQALQIHVNRTEFREQDMLVPWQLKKPRSRAALAAPPAATDCGDGQTFHRFYHVFQQGELDALCSQVAGCAIRRSYYDQGNWCVVLQKS